MRNFSMADTVWINKGHEFDEVARLIKTRQDNIYLYGEQNEIDSFLAKNDIAIPIQGQIQIDNAGSIQLPQNQDLIIVSCTFDRAVYENAKNAFEKLGYKENVDFFQGEVFRQIWCTYFRDEIRLDRIEIFMTSYCTLNCEKCIAYIPYFKKREHFDLNCLKSDADLLFSKVDYVYKLKLLGGDALVYPHLMEYVEYLYEQYASKIGSIRIGTNGTILPSDELMELCKRCNVIVDVSDYTKGVPERCKLDEVVKLLQENGVQYDIKRVGEQWLDMGFPEHPYQPSNDDEIKEHFHKCAMFCRDFFEGKLYFCCSNFAAIKAGLFRPDENDFFDFNKPFTKKELMEFELGYNTRGHLTFCAVCQGCSDEANCHQVEVAKQTERKHEDL